jgi:hypothetical protein
MAGECPEYLDYVRRRKCCAPGPHSGRIEAHHAGERGLGQRASDWTAIPLCTYHHRCFHDCSGTFRGWSKDQRRAWIAERIAETRRGFGRALPEWA